MSRILTNLTIQNSYQYLLQISGSQVQDGLGNDVDVSVDAYTKSQSDARYLGITSKAADSDKLDGHDSSYFLAAAAKAVDSDKLDGHDSSYFLAATAKAADSDKLDNLDSSQFVRSDTADSISGVLTFSARPAFNGGTTGVNSPFTVDSTYVVANLNADLLDGVQGSSFLRSDTADQKTSGNLTFNDNIKIGFGTSDGEGTLYSNGTATYWDFGADKDLIMRDVTATRFTFDISSGSFISTGNITAAAFFESSDITLKENIQPIGGIFKTFNFKDNPIQKRYGVIAQEVEIDNPELVQTNKEGLKSVNYIDLLIKTVAEQQLIIDELKDDIRQIKDRF